MVVGTKWGALECIEVKSGVLEDAGGAVQETIRGGSGVGPGVIWKLRCGCGRVVEVESDRFPGRKKMRSCGECELDGGGGSEGVRPLGRPMKPGGRKGPVSLYLPLELIERLEREAKSKGVSFSELVRGMLARVDETVGSLREIRECD